jgi:hypothetical protein
MKPSALRDWVGPTLGAAMALLCAGGLAYKVINGYQRASPEHFVSVQDQNKQPAASANAPTAITPAPPVAPADALENASSVAADADLPAEAQDDSACAAIETEQHEIEAALVKQYSPEESRYLQRRLRELEEQSVKRQCGK